MNLEELKKEMPGIFEKVKEDVKKTLGYHRAGLSLGLAELGVFRGSFVGGMHFSPGTDIIMNKTPLKIILEEQAYEIVWSFTYHILLHEYIHSLGILDEQQCRMLTLKISKEIFKDADHPTIILAKRGIGTYFANLHLIYAPPEYHPDGISIEYVYGFDRESYSYYS